MRVEGIRLLCGMSVLVILSALPRVSAQSVTTAGGNPHATVTEATRTDSTAPLRLLPTLPPLPKVLGQVFERPRKLLPGREESAAPVEAVDSAVQGPTAQTDAPVIGPDFDGVGNENSVLPPDPTGAAGPNHYVQMVNLSFAIWDKNGTKLYGPADNKTLWQGFGGACEASNDGDPIVLYDQLADRWMLSQFALPNYPRGPFFQCIAVSQGPDPINDGWYRYEFLMSNSKLNDYPKFGLWPDAYYMSFNQFSCKFISCSWAGQGVVAFERGRLLNPEAGTPRMVSFDLYTTDPNLGGMLPSTLDGTNLPPSGAPNPFIQIDDNAWGYSGDQLQMWQFHVDWNNASASTFQFVRNLPTAPFDSNMCGYSRNCIPQGGTSIKVDSLADRLMYRQQYRNFGAHQTIVVNHTVDTGGDHAGIRWYELRNTGGGWSIYQQATYSPDANHRWVASAAMNGKGEIGLAFSKSSSSMFPSIYATGRLGTDTLNEMTKPEILIKAGGGSQSHTSGRWGDYSQLTVDPVDDCTFWYTQEYYPAGASSAGWKTFIGSFQLSACGGGVTPDVHDVAVLSVSGPASSMLNVAKTVSVNVQNQGNVSETFNVSLTDLDASISPAQQSVTLSAGASTQVDFTWTPTTTGAHTLEGAASAVPNESDPNDNKQSIVVDVSGPSGGATTSHVESLTPSSRTQGKAKWRASVTIRVVDNLGEPVSGATVSGTFAPGGNVACTTTAGVCSVDLISIPNNVNSATYTVNSVSHPTLVYDGSHPSVTINKP